MLTVHPHVRGEHPILPRPSERHPVHPHVRGEHRDQRPAIDWLSTVHPHVRGEHSTLRTLNHVAIRRFIPTCVGNITGPHDAASSHGSSPRAWGTLLISSQRLRCQRFIPTCVGNYVSVVAEGISYRFIPTCVGNTVHTSCMPMPARFIPTCVGNIYRWPACHVATAVHPHVCGEHLRHRMLDRRQAVHPHVCGEHRAARMPRNCQSVHPHVRGEHLDAVPFGLRDRFIPTCVGNSLQDGCTTNSLAGSSPRMWGTLFLEPFEIRKIF